MSRIVLSKRWRVQLYSSWFSVIIVHSRRHIEMNLLAPSERGRIRGEMLRRKEGKEEKRIDRVSRHRK